MGTGHAGVSLVFYMHACSLQAMAGNERPQVHQYDPQLSVTWQNK